MSWENQPRDSKGRFLPKGSRSQSQQTKKHTLRGPDGRFISNKDAAPASTKKPARCKQKSDKDSWACSQDVSEQVTHVAVLLDASSSMSGLKRQAMDMFNSQLMSIRAESFRTKQSTKVSTYTFTTGGWGGYCRGEINIQSIDREQFPEATQQLNNQTYVPAGWTPLVSAVAKAIDDFHQIPEANDMNHSFLMIVVTDGEENSSHHRDRVRIPALIRQLQATDRWTFTFSVPHGHTSNICSYFGVPAGNVQEWEQTEQGYQVMSQGLTRGTTTYYDSRAKGATSVKDFFADLGKVSQRDLKRLDDVTKSYRSWQIPKETSITEFVDDKLSSTAVAQQVGHSQYMPGHAFYELTKPEKVQSYKDILIMDRESKKIYGGPRVRTVLGADSGDLKVKIKNLSTYRVFIQSTSSNRKLVRGSTLLYKKTT